MWYKIAGILVILWCAFLAYQEEIYEYLNVDNESLPEWLQYPKKIEPPKTQGRTSVHKPSRDVWK